MSLLHLDKSTFDTEIKDGKTLVDFWAPWCGPCRMLGPVIESMAEGRTDGVKIAKVNVDENPEIAQRFRVYSIPTLILFENGVATKQTVGFQSREKLEDFIK